MKIRFLQTVTVKDAEARTFHEGEVVDLAEPSANHWVRRGLAAEVAGVGLEVEAAAVGAAAVGYKARRRKRAAL